MLWGGVAHFQHDETDKLWGIKAPCQSGDMLFLCETWDKFHDERWLSGGYRYVYKADDLPYVHWRSPVTMPNKACRHVWSKWKIEAVRVKDILQAELYHIQEAPPTFVKWVEETHPELSMDSWLWIIEKEEEK